MSFRVVCPATTVNPFAVIGAGALLLALSACATSSTPAPTPTVTASESSPTAEPSPSATTNSGTPLTLTCDQLISLQAMYDYNPNLILDPQYVPAAGSLASKTAQYRGLACAWVNETSGERIAVTVAQPSADALSQIGNELISSSNSVPTYQVEGYFQLKGNLGEAEAISDPYWITASSTSFLEPGDAAPIIDAVRVGLGQ